MILHSPLLDHPQLQRQHLQLLALPQQLGINRRRHILILILINNLGQLLIMFIELVDGVAPDEWFPWFIKVLELEGVLEVFDDFVFVGFVGLDLVGGEIGGLLDFGEGGEDLVFGEFGVQGFPKLGFGGVGGVVGADAEGEVGRRVVLLHLEMLLLWNMERRKKEVEGEIENILEIRIIKKERVVMWEK